MNPALLFPWLLSKHKVEDPCHVVMAEIAAYAQYSDCADKYFSSFLHSLQSVDYLLHH
jgi:hypothetical protein